MALLLGSFCCANRIRLTRAAVRLFTFTLKHAMLSRFLTTNVVNMVAISANIYWHGQCADVIWFEVLRYNLSQLIFVYSLA